MTPEASALAARNVPMVYAIARDQQRRLGGDVDELVGDGMVALVECAARFDPARGVLFWRFSKQRITGSMVDGHRRRNRNGHGHGRGTPVRLVSMDEAPIGEVPAAEQQAFDRFALADLLEAVHEMGERDVAVLQVAIDGGRFIAHAAKVGDTPAAIATRLYSARKKLRLRLAA